MGPRTSPPLGHCDAANGVVTPIHNGATGSLGGVRVPLEPYSRSFTASSPSDRLSSNTAYQGGAWLDRPGHGASGQISFGSNTECDRGAAELIARNRPTFKKWGKLANGQLLEYNGRKFYKPKDEETLLTRLVGSVLQDHRKQKKNDLHWWLTRGYHYEFLPRPYCYSGHAEIGIAEAISSFPPPMVTAVETALASLAGGEGVAVAPNADLTAGMDLTKLEHNVCESGGKVVSMVTSPPMTVTKNLEMLAELAGTVNPISIQLGDPVSAQNSIHTKQQKMVTNFKRGRPTKTVRVRVQLPANNIWVYVDGNVLCPHLMSQYPRGNIYNGKYITPKQATSLQTFGRDQVPSLLYDGSEKGFTPNEWHFHVGKNEDIRLSLLDQDGGGDDYRNLVHVHRSTDIDELNFLCNVTSKLIHERHAVRRTKGWDSRGKMVGIGEHIDRNGVHCDFVIKPEFRNQWSSEVEKTMMKKSGFIFKKHFGGKSVGFEEMIQHQKYLWAPDCPDEVTDVPRCWNASLNLGNEMHRDRDGDRSFAVWVSNNKESSKSSWYLLFPEWEVAIEICHGTWISWNGKFCGHCSAVPNLAEGEQLLSLFCSIPQNLCEHLRNKK